MERRAPAEHVARDQQGNNNKEDSVKNATEQKKLMGTSG